MCGNMGGGGSNGNRTGRIDVSNLPPLTGVSERQIKYGEDRRSQIIAAYNHFLTAYDEINENGLSDIELQNAKSKKQSLKSSIDSDAMFAVEVKQPDGSIEKETLDLRFIDEWDKEKQKYKVKGEPIPKGTKVQFKEKMRIDALKKKKKEIEQMIEEHKNAKWWIEHTWQ